jgi:hypothetical protein
MNVEERCFGVPLTPEVRSLMRTVFERTFARVADQVDNVRVRMFSVRDGVECRVVLRPYTGPTLAITETRPSTIEALIASAYGLAHELQRRSMGHGHGSRRHRMNRRRRSKLEAQA